VPHSVDISTDTVSFGAEWHIKGVRKQETLSIPRNSFDEAEHSFAVSPYPHRELVSYDARGRLSWRRSLPVPFTSSRTCRAKFATSSRLHRQGTAQLRERPATSSRDGCRESSATSAPKDPGNEAFVVAHAFDYRKPYLLMRGMPVEITGDQALARHRKAAAYRPSLEEQVSLIEAASISYFQTSKYNNHYLDFPRRHHRVLRPVYDADFAFLSVQVDHEKIGGQRLYSQKIPPASDHLAFTSISGRVKGSLQCRLSVRIDDRPADLLRREPS